MDEPRNTAQSPSHEPTGQAVDAALAMERIEALARAAETAANAIADPAEREQFRAHIRDLRDAARSSMAMGNAAAVYGIATQMQVVQSAATAQASENTTDRTKEQALVAQDGAMATLRQEVLRDRPLMRRIHDMAMDIHSDRDIARYVKASVDPNTPPEILHALTHDMVAVFKHPEGRQVAEAWNKIPPHEREATLVQEKMVEKLADKKIADPHTPPETKHVLEHAKKTGAIYAGGMQTAIVQNDTPAMKAESAKHEAAMEKHMPEANRVLPEPLRGTASGIGAHTLLQRGMAVENDPKRMEHVKECMRAMEKGRSTDRMGAEVLKDTAAYRAYAVARQETIMQEIGEMARAKAITMMAGDKNHGKAFERHIDDDVTTIMAAMSKTHALDGKSNESIKQFSQELRHTLVVAEQQGVDFATLDKLNKNEKAAFNQHLKESAGDVGWQAIKEQNSEHAHTAADRVGKDLQKKLDHYVPHVAARIVGTAVKDGLSLAADLAIGAEKHISGAVAAPRQFHLNGLGNGSLKVIGDLLSQQGVTVDANHDNHRTAEEVQKAVNDYNKTHADRLPTADTHHAPTAAPHTPVAAKPAVKAPQHSH